MPKAGKNGTSERRRGLDQATLDQRRVMDARLKEFYDGKTDPILTPFDMVREALKDPERARREIVASLCRDSFYEFTKRAWPYLHGFDPRANPDVRPLVEGQVLEVLCNSLQAVTEGKIKRLLVNIPPGTAKPVAETELVMTARGRIPLSEVVVGDRVLTHKGRFMPVTEVHLQGQLDILRIVTTAGREILAAPDHPFLATRGWIEARHLTDRDVLAAVVPDWQGSETMTLEAARFLGYLVGDGGLVTGVRFTNSDPEILEDFEQCARSLGFSTNRRATKSRATDITVNAQHSSRLSGFIKLHGLHQSNSYTKRIPLAVLAGTKEIIANYLGAHWSCDGSISIRHAGLKSSHVAKVTTVGKDLASDLQHAMLRVGISTRIRTRKVRLESKKQPGGIYTSYDVQTTEASGVVAVARLPGLCSRKARIGAEATQRFFEQGPLREDEVVSVSPAGKANCRCLTVEEDRSFTANDIAVHNTTIVNVLWPAWEWGPRGLPHMRYISGSYQETLATTAIVDSRRLVMTPWYQGMWPIEFAPDANEKTFFKNTKTGFRKAVSVGGALLGFRGDRLIIDDPHDRESAESEVERATALDWWSHTVQTRLNDPAKSAIVVIMQRLHVNDISGHILSKTPEGWAKLILPMEYDPGRHCRIPEIGYEDWRTEQNELLFPERFSRETVDELKRNMSARGGSYAVAGQLQQLPIPDTGGMFKGRPRIMDTLPQMRVRVRGWDLAATEGKGDYTCGVLIGIGTDNQVYILDVVRFRGSPHAVTEKVIETAARDGHAVHISIPQDPGQAGKHQKAFFAGKLHGYNVHFSTETGSKAHRAKPLSAQWEAGNVSAKKAGWNDQYIDEALLFPTDEIDYDDQIDASTRAYARALQVNGSAAATIAGGVLIEYPSD